MNNMVKRISIIAVMICLVVAFMPALGGSAHAASVKLNKKTVYLAKGKTVKLKVKGTKAKVKWSSSNKKIATVSKSGKVKGKKIGKCTITAKVKGKKLKCKVIVESKAANQARKLRDYVLKKGKKDSHTGYYTITREYTDPDNDESIIRADIKAKKDSKKLTFEWSNNCSTPAEYYSVSMTINLISNKSVKTGSLQTFFQDNYSDNVYTYRFGKISTKFDGGEAGITVTKLEDVDGETETIVTDPTQLKEETSYMGAGAALAFVDWNVLAKKAKVSMKSIGFSKYAPRQ